MLCNTLIRDPTNASARTSLLEANKADILALAKVLKALANLPIKSSEAVSDQITRTRQENPEL